MAQDFPNNPTLGQVFGSYVWNGTAWAGIGSANNLGVQVGGILAREYNPNYIINGAFEINQRAFISTTTNGAYGFDRWKLFYSGGSTTYSAQAFTPGTAPVAGYEAQNYARLVTTGYTSSGWSILQQPIEDVRTFAGQTITLSFWAKADSGTPKIMPSVEQNFGSGGSPSSPVRTKGSAVTLSTSWARYSVTISVPSISGKTIGSTPNTSSIFAELWVSGEDAGYQNATFDIWGVQVEAGSTATPFRRNANSIQGELAACQRYYYRADRINLGEAVPILGSYYSSTTCYLVAKLPQQMRAFPTFASSAQNNIHLYSANAQRIATSVSSPGVNSYNYQMIGVTTAAATAGYIAHMDLSTGWLEWSAEL